MKIIEKVGSLLRTLKRERKPKSTPYDLPPYHYYPTSTVKYYTIPKERLVNLLVENKPQFIDSYVSIQRSASMKQYRLDEHTIYLEYDEPSLSLEGRSLVHGNFSIDTFSSFSFTIADYAFSHAFVQTPNSLIQSGALGSEVKVEARGSRTFDYALAWLNKAAKEFEY